MLIRAKVLKALMDVEVSLLPSFKTMFMYHADQDMYVTHKGKQLLLK